MSLLEVECDITHATKVNVGGQQVAEIQGRSRGHLKPGPWTDWVYHGRATIYNKGDKYEFPSISEGDFEFGGYYQWRENKDDAKQKSVVKAGRDQGVARCHKKFD